MSEQVISKHRRNIIVSVMILSGFISILNQTLLNTALPSIMRGLHVGENTAQWLVTGFMLVNGVMIPLTAYLMDKVKTRPLYLASMGIFLFGTIVAAIAPNFGVLMTARVIQAMGAGIIMPLMQFTLFSLFPRDKRGFAMGLAGLVISFAPAIGPTLSGLIIDISSWRVPFIAVAVIAGGGFIFGATSISNYNDPKDITLDKLSVVYSTLGFGVMLYAFSNAGSLGFTSWMFYVPLILSLIVIAIFIKRQLTISNPILNLRVFKNKTFTLTTICSMIVMMSMIGPALLIPMYVQNAMGLSALLSGVVILPGAIINGAMSIYTGKAYDKYGVRPLIMIGFTLLIILTGVLAFLKVDTPYWLLVVVYALRMFSVSILTMPLNTAGVNALPNKDISHGTAIMNFARMMASSIGTALMVALMTTGAKAFAPKPHAGTSKELLQREAVARGVDLSFGVITILVIIGLIVGLFVRDKEKGSKAPNVREI